MNSTMPSTRVVDSTPSSSTMVALTSRISRLIRSKYSSSKFLTITMGGLSFVFLKVTVTTEVLTSRGSPSSSARTSNEITGIVSKSRDPVTTRLLSPAMPKLEMFP